MWLPEMYEIVNVPKRVMFSGCRGSFGFIYVGDILVKKKQGSHMKYLKIS